MIVEKFYHRESYSDAHTRIKDFLTQNDSNELLILGIAGIGKSTLVNKIHSTIQSESILIKGGGIPLWSTKNIRRPWA